MTGRGFAQRCSLKAARWPAAGATIQKAYPLNLSEFTGRSAVSGAENAFRFAPRK